MSDELIENDHFFMNDDQSMVDEFFMNIHPIPASLLHNPSMLHNQSMLYDHSVQDDYLMKPKPSMPHNFSMQNNRSVMDDDDDDIFLTPRKIKEADLDLYQMETPIISKIMYIRKYIKFNRKYKEILKIFKK